MSIKKLLTLAVCGLCLLGAVTAGEIAPGVSFSARHEITIGEVTLARQFFDENWTGSGNKFADIKITQGNPSVCEGKIKFPGHDQDFRETISRTASGFALAGHYTLPPANIKTACLTLILPSNDGITLQIDGKDLPLPEKFDRLVLAHNQNVQKAEVQLADGKRLTVSGGFTLTVQDNRKFGNDNFSLRFHCQTLTAETAEIALDFAFTDARCQPADLRPAANRGFADNNGIGWTDQGPDNDLHAFTEKEVVSGALRFPIIDPAQNNGNAALVLGGKLPTRAETALPRLPGARALNLLHASAWTLPAGTLMANLRVTYADGNEQTIPVISRRDCNEWWNPDPAANAYPLWVGENDEARIGLYGSSFPLSQDNPVKLAFELLTTETRWMVAGVALTDMPIHFSASKDARNKPCDIRPGLEWAPLASPQDIIPQSPLDFSWITQGQAPAGKFGRIINRDGHLVFADAPEKRIRLYGANLCFTANYLEKEEVDKLVPRLARMGYNSMRFHHHDGLLLDPQAADSVTFNAANLDKLDYLFFKLKEAGIYITTDMYVNRVFRPGDNIPECKNYQDRCLKSLVAASDAVLANWKEFTRRLLTHKNPYTGLTWGEDPALYMITLVNEGTLSRSWGETPFSRELHRERFRAWAESQGVENKNASDSNPDFVRYLDELERTCLREQIRFCKEELKVQTLVTSLNWINDFNYTLARDYFDLVDNHHYFDHPSFPEKSWVLPFSHNQRCAIADFAVTPAAMMPTRIFGKPFTVTEFNYCMPNRHRAEGGSLVGAYAALQDWDALYRFAWSHHHDRVTKVKPLSGFDIAGDPLGQFTDKLAIAMFVRGDVRPANAKFSAAVPDDIYRFDSRAADRNFRRLGLIAQIGSHPAGKTPPGAAALTLPQTKTPDELPDAAVRKLWREAAQGKCVRSDTGELCLRAEDKVFTVDTPRAASVTLPGGGADAGILSVRGAKDFQTVAAVSLDGQPLKDSRSILLFQLTDVLNSGTVFKGAGRYILTQRGELPLLVRKDRADVTLAIAGPLTVTALNNDGTPRENLPVTAADGKQTFTVSTANGVMAYHLTRK